MLITLGKILDACQMFFGELESRVTVLYHVRGIA